MEDGSNKYGITQACRLLKAIGYSWKMPENIGAWKENEDLYCCVLM